jgi:UDP-glucose 4-epimerase
MSKSSLQAPLTDTGNPKDALIIGGCGFIGSHFVDRLLGDPQVVKVTVFDNLSAGYLWHIESHSNDKRLIVKIADVRDLPLLIEAAIGHSTVIHLASNPDIAAAATNPSIDFDQGTLLTHCVAEAARISGVKTVLYASGSGVYGDIGELEAEEDFGPLIPVSTYAASKLAGEALLSSYAYMFDLRTVAFRFGNVVGPRQTHGVGFDFIRQLVSDSKQLKILGDGKQSKSYVFVEDILNAVLTANAKSLEPFNVFNVATGDYITVSQIAELACEALNIDANKVKFEYSGGSRGWKGDVPVVRLSSNRIRSLGWLPKRKSAAALLDAMRAMSIEPRTSSK